MLDREDKILVYLICMRSSLPWRGIANRGCPGENCLSEHLTPADLEIFYLKSVCMNTLIVKGIFNLMRFFRTSSSKSHPLKNLSGSSKLLISKGKNITQPKTGK